MVHHFDSRNTLNEFIHKATFHDVEFWGKFVREYPPEEKWEAVEGPETIWAYQRGTFQITVEPDEGL